MATLRDTRTKALILARTNRLAAGNFGDCKALRKGVMELRINHGPGFRVYFARVETHVVLLLCGGDKRSQAADIDKAVERLLDFKERTQQ